MSQKDARAVFIMVLSFAKIIFKALLGGNSYFTEPLLFSLLAYFDRRHQAFIFDKDFIRVKFELKKPHSKPFRVIEINKFINIK